MLNNEEIRDLPIPTITTKDEDIVNGWWLPAVQVIAKAQEQATAKEIATILEDVFMKAPHDGCVIFYSNKEHDWWKFLMALKNGELPPVTNRSK